MYSVETIATVGRERRITHSKFNRISRKMPVPANEVITIKTRQPKSPSLIYRDSCHYQIWQSSLATQTSPDWEPPEYYFFYKVIGPETLPKVKNTINLTLVPAMFTAQVGRVYITDTKGYLKIAAQVNAINEVHSLDSDKWYNLTVTVTTCREQKRELPDVYQKGLTYIPKVNDRLRLIYNPDGRTGAIQSYSHSVLGRPNKMFTAPYFHFDNCIECQNKTHQIGYVTTRGPQFATIDHLYDHPQEISGKIFDYWIDKIVCAKTSNQLTITTRQSFLLRVEALLINGEKRALPGYHMVVGRILSCYRPNLYPGEPEFAAKRDDESDKNLFLPGTYIYIDHFLNQPQDKLSIKRRKRHKIIEDKKHNPYDDNTETAQIGYIVGPGTPKFGSTPIRPFS